MAPNKATTNRTKVPFVTARNPYALAETVLGHPVDWGTVTDRRTFLEDVLQTPYELLFDPANDSPVYLGFGVDERGDVVPRPPQVPEAGDDAARDVDQYPAVDLSGVRKLADVATLLGADALEAPVRALAPSRAGGWTIEVGLPPERRAAMFARLFDRETLTRLWEHGIFELGWTPAGAEWADTGSFFKESAEYFDPIQGQLGDCWLIAAESSVAWALPYTVAQRSRATGTGNESFTNRLDFVDPADGSTHTFEATDRTVVYTGTTSPLYGRSSEPGELWPAVVEKAYAMWRGNGQSFDRPDLTVLNGGDPVHASATLTGRKPHYTWTAGQTAAQLATLVKSHAVSFRTVDPMTAWTYPTGSASPDNVTFSDANIVANHAYSVLGWASGTRVVRALQDRLTREVAVHSAVLPAGAPQDLGPAGTLTGARSVGQLLDTSFLESVHLDWRTFLQRDYIVLRNPWGSAEATAGNLHGAIPLKDISFWRTIDLGDVDGVFAIDFPTFKRYFQGIGVAL